MLESINYLSVEYFYIFLMFTGLAKSWSPPVAEKEKKKKKLDVKEVFNTDDDDDSNLGTKKRKLIPLGII